MPTDKLAVLIAIAAVWVAFAWWTVRRLWRTPKDPRDAWFANSVKIESVAISSLGALFMPDAIPIIPLAYWLQVGFWAIYVFPAMLWAAHFGMRMFRAFVDNYYS